MLAKIIETDGDQTGGPLLGARLLPALEERICLEAFLFGIALIRTRAKSSLPVLKHYSRMIEFEQFVGWKLGSPSLDCSDIARDLAHERSSALVNMIESMEGEIMLDCLALQWA